MRRVTWKRVSVFISSILFAVVALSNAFGPKKLYTMELEANLLSVNVINKQLILVGSYYIGEIENIQWKYTQQNRMKIDVVNTEIPDARFIGRLPDGTLQSKGQFYYVSSWTTNTSDGHVAIMKKADGSAEFRNIDVGSGWSYDRAIWVDMDRDRRRDCLTARYRDGVGQLLYFSQPRGQSGWNQVIINEGEADGNFLTIKHYKRNYIVVAANQFSSLVVFWTTHPKGTWEDSKRLRKTVVDNYGKYYDVQYIDLNNDKRKDILTTTVKVADARGQVLGYDLPDDLRHGKWQRHVLAAGFTADYSPGKAIAYFPNKFKEKHERPSIFLTGGTSAKLYLLSPRPKNKGWAYVKTHIAVSAVGAVGIPWIGDLNGDSYPEVFVPQGNKLHVFAYDYVTSAAEAPASSASNNDDAKAKFAKLPSLTRSPYVRPGQSSKKPTGPKKPAGPTQTMVTDPFFEGDTKRIADTAGAGAKPDTTGGDSPDEETVDPAAGGGNPPPVEAAKPQPNNGGKMVFAKVPTYQQSNNNNNNVAPQQPLPNNVLTPNQSGRQIFQPVPVYPQQPAVGGQQPVYPNQVVVQRPVYPQQPGAQYPVVYPNPQQPAPQPVYPVVSGGQVPVYPPNVQQQQPISGRQTFRPVYGNTNGVQQQPPGYPVVQQPGYPVQPVQNNHPNIQPFVPQQQNNGQQQQPVYPPPNGAQVAVNNNGGRAVFPSYVAVGNGPTLPYVSRPYYMAEQPQQVGGGSVPYVVNVNGTLMWVVPNPPTTPSPQGDVETTTAGMLEVPKVPFLSLPEAVFTHHEIAELACLAENRKLCSLKQLQEAVRVVDIIPDLVWAWYEDPTRAAKLESCIPGEVVSEGYECYNGDVVHYPVLSEALLQAFCCATVNGAVYTEGKFTSHEDADAGCKSLDHHLCSYEEMVDVHMQSTYKDLAWGWYDVRDYMIRMSSYCLEGSQLWSGYHCSEGLFELSEIKNLVEESAFCCPPSSASKLISFSSLFCFSVFVHVIAMTLFA